MRKMNGYNHFHFLRDDFMFAEYLLLIDLINKELKEEEKASKKSKK